MSELTTLRVFVDEAEQHGNRVGVVVDEGGTLTQDARIAITRGTGYSECVFVESISERRIRTYTGQQEIPFAGHAALGAAWYLSEVANVDAPTLRAPESEIEVFREEGILWVGAELRTTPPWWHERLPDAAAINTLSGPQAEAQEHTQLWAWIDEPAGRARSRTFAAGWGIPEDEANGSGCMRLAAALGRRMEIIHGSGSVIFARPGQPGSAQVGGRVKRDSTVPVETAVA